MPFLFFAWLTLFGSESRRRPFDERNDEHSSVSSLHTPMRTRNSMSLLLCPLPLLHERVRRPVSVGDAPVECDKRVLFEIRFRCDSLLRRQLRIRDRHGEHGEKRKGRGEKGGERERGKWKLKRSEAALSREKSSDDRQRKKVSGLLQQA